MVKTPDLIYVIELKFDKSAEEAMTLVDEKQYALPFAKDPRRLFKIGLNFSSKTRRLDNPLIEEAEK